MKINQGVWDTLDNLHEGSENIKEKCLTLVGNDFDTFTTKPIEFIASTSNLYIIMVNNMIFDAN